jgi:predicted RNA methylase
MNKIERKKLDKFYTKKDVALECYNDLKKILDFNNISEVEFLEPSAGNGSFLSIIKEPKIGFDIYPENNEILKCDYLTTDISNFLNKKLKTVVIGNPPFGKNSSLAVKFLNKSFEYSDIVGFVLPKTFKKESIKNRINLSFSCIFEKDLIEDSFFLGEENYSVPCVFQIWVKSDFRQKNKYIKNENHIKFTTKEEASYAIRRVGDYAGKIFKEFKEYSNSSNYFINCSPDIYTLIAENFKQLNNLAKNTAGNPSLSKQELLLFVDVKCKSIMAESHLV